MYIPVKVMTWSLLLVLFCSVRSEEARAFVYSQQADKQAVAVLPFQQKGLSEEETAQVTHSFADALQAAGTYAVLDSAEMFRLLSDAQFNNLEGCTYSYCLADAGKVLGVPIVFHGSVTRRGKLYTVRIRQIRADNAEILYDKQQEYSGEFDQFVTDVLPREAREASEQQLESGTRWYVVAAILTVTVGAIYSIYRAFRSGPTEGSAGGGPPTTQ